VKFVATKNGLAKKDFSHLSFVAVFGSGMAKNQDPGSGINIPDPQHWLFSQMFSHKPGGGGGGGGKTKKKQFKWRKREVHI
jgi:hypothetical protein